MCLKWLKACDVILLNDCLDQPHEYQKLTKKFYVKICILKRPKTFFLVVRLLLI